MAVMQIAGSSLGPVAVTASGADVLVRVGMETLTVKAVATVKAAITGASLAA